MGLVAGAAIGAVGAIGSAVVGNSGASKAAAANTAAADRSAAVVERNYDLSAQALQPWQTGGLQAFNSVNSLLGLGGQQQQQQPNALSQFQTNRTAGMNTGQFNPAEGMARWASVLNPQQQQFQSPTQQMQPGISSQHAASNAFDVFRNSTGYKFRLGEGERALNAGWAGSGTLKSGAAGKAFQEYGQNFASNEFANYLASLGNQQSLGLNAARAQAGVGGDAANSLAQIYTNQGQNLAAIAGAKAQNTGNAINQLGTILGGVFGGSGGNNGGNSGSNQFQMVRPGWTGL
jgi:hypothetical protein